MDYNFQLAMSAKISRQVAEDMIRRVVEEQTGRKVSSIEVKLNKVTRGMGAGESTETLFEGFQVFFQEEQHPKSVKAGDPGFVKATYQ